MKKTLLLSLAMLVSQVSFAQGAAIVASPQNHDGVQKISVNAAGAILVDGKSAKDLSIKNFDTDGAYETYCYDGSYTEVKKILEALVAAADGDGDSYAELKSIKKDGDSIEVKAKITDESGANVKSYTFSKCD